MQAGAGDSARICILCKKSCEGAPRIKDKKGRYMHSACYEKAKAKLAQRAAAGGAAGAPPRSASAPAASVTPAGATARKPPAVPGRADAKPRAAAAARPRAVAAAAPSAIDLGGLGGLNELAVAESKAAPLAAPVRSVCPSCAGVIPAGAVVCMTCGFNVQTGEFATVTKGVSFAPAEKRKRGGGGMSMSSLGGIGALLGNPLILWGGMLTLVVLWFVGVKDGSEASVDLWVLTTSLFSLGVAIWLLVLAFQEGTGKGFMCLCIPFYSVYFAYCEADSSHLKGAFTVSLVARVLAFFVNVETV